MKSNKNDNAVSTFTNGAAMLQTKRFAFTLAEVLITLGIIGVVAAMTIPGLIAKYQDQATVSQLKETYSILTQSIKMAEEEYGELDSWDAERDEAGANILGAKLKPFMKIALDCGTTDSNNSCIDSDTIYQRLNGSNFPEDFKSNYFYKLALNNGSLVFLDRASETEPDSYIFIYVDTNGKSKPNRAGYDLFEFSYKKGIGLLPSGNPQVASNSYKYYCSNRSQYGYGCAYYVLTFGNRDYLKKK